MIAAAPAACPMAMQEAFTRMAELQARSLETQRPAVKTFVSPFGRSAPRDTVGVNASFRYTIWEGISGRCISINQ